MDHTPLPSTDTYQFVLTKQSFVDNWSLDQSDIEWRQKGGIINQFKSFCGLTTPDGWLSLLQLIVLSQSAIIVYSKFLVAFFLLSRCFLDFSVGVGDFVTELSHMSYFFFKLVKFWCSLTLEINHDRPYGKHLEMEDGINYV